MAQRTALIPVFGSNRPAVVDANDAALVMQHKWYVSWKRDIAYARANASRANGAPCGSILLHRLILNAEAGQVVDHADRDGLNNCRSNLRLCTPQKNSFNKRKQVGSVSPYKGVTLSNRGRWRSRITCDGVTRHLGYFHSKEDAAKAYDVAAALLFGEYARGNFQ